MNKKKKILQGYKKTGSKFVSPMNSLPNMKSMSYVDFILPELIWIGLINDNLGYIKGARLLEIVFITINEIIGNEVTEEKIHNTDNGTYENFAYISSFKKLDTDQKKQLQSSFAEKDVLKQLQNYLAPLVLLYDDFPMNFIGSPNEIIEEEDLIERISISVGKHRDKYDTPGIILHGSALLSSLVTQKICLPRDMDLPDFNAVVFAPDSDEAKRAAGFMRANVLGEFGMLEIKDQWAKYFWKRSYDLRPCKRT